MPKKASRLARRVPERSTDIVERNEAERDRDRVLYSTAFRRLDGVTQVAGSGEVALLHNRLTHSIKVGQVGRKIAATVLHHAQDEDIRKACYKFGGATRADIQSGIPPVDSWVLEAAGLIHDLGHPPFGHVAEQELMRVLSSRPNAQEAARENAKYTVEATPALSSGYDLPDSFEGNAQSFRIVTRLAFGRYSQRRTGNEGLNLTKAVLAGMSKYPWTYAHRPPGVDVVKKKWGAYDSEKGVLDWCMSGVNTGGGRVVRAGSPLLEFRSIEAQAMDWADDVTYAVHDLEDFCRAGLIPIGELTADGHRALVRDFENYCRVRIEANDVLMDGMKSSGRDFDSLFRTTRTFLRPIADFGLGGRLARENMRWWASQAIDNWTHPETLRIDKNTGVLQISSDVRLRVEVLKNLTWFFVIERPALGSAQKGQRRLMRELFSWLTTWAEESYEGPPAGGKPRTKYYSRGLPHRLIDFLDIAFSTSPAGGGYTEEQRSLSRAVVDYIVSLTENQAVDLARRLGGQSEGSMLSGWFAT